MEEHQQLTIEQIVINIKKVKKFYADNKDKQNGKQTSKNKMKRKKKVKR